MPGTLVVVVLAFLVFVSLPVLDRSVGTEVEPRVYAFTGAVSHVGRGGEPT